MPLKTRTVTSAVHRTNITYEAPAGASKDGGRAWLAETFKLINSNRQVGSLTVNFGFGGSISSITFSESEIIPQKDIEFDSDDENSQSPN